MNTESFSRGAEWRQWDLHIHTPASFHWDGTKFDSDPNSPLNKSLVDEMISTLNSAAPAVFALMDYWTFNGWFALKKRLGESDAPKLNKRVFPGIELRLAAPTKCRLNAHVLFSDEVKDQDLNDFKSTLKVELIERALSDTALIDLARLVGEDKLRHHNFKKNDVDANAEIALLAGSVIAEINCESYKDAIQKVPNGQAIGFMPFDTSDGLNEVKWQEHYAYFIGLFKSSPIFETRNNDLRSAFVGEETIGNASWIKNFQTGLRNIPRLAVSGSDAHRFIGTIGNNDKRGYGNFPSGKATWIKADPTFLGLLQAIKEPAKRSYIGLCPEKLEEVNSNKTFFIDNVTVEKISDSALTDEWLTNCDLTLNHDLVAIIGNKGSGKSALADIIALLGNSRQKNHFSFLKRDRFRGKSGEPAKQFIGKLNWHDRSCKAKNLSENPDEDTVELVRYIPQGHFEELCNEHVTGHSNALEQQIRAVIFSHASESIRLGALDFDQLIKHQEGTFRDQLGELRKDLNKINQEIESIEIQLQPDLKKKIQEYLALVNKQIVEHDKIKPKSPEKPSEQPNTEQQQVSVLLDGIAKKLKAIDEKISVTGIDDGKLAAKSKSNRTIRDRLAVFEKQYKQFLDETKEDLEIIGLDLRNLVTVTFNVHILESLSEEILNKQKTLKDLHAEYDKEKQSLLLDQSSQNLKLNEPQLIYQQEIRAMEIWQAKREELFGTNDAPDTLNGLEKRIDQLNKLPEILTEKQTVRLQLCGEIFDVLDAQRKTREELFKPVQALTQSNTLIREDYKLQFQATLSGSSDSISSTLFGLIKQNSGEFRGEDESYSAVKNIYDRFNFNKKEDVLKFVSELDKQICDAASGSNKNVVGIGSILRRDKKASMVYDLLFGLSFLEPRFTLLFQETQIQQLSPGQKGALLLIFYLLVDKGHNPIILDQPEENLDNETVFNLLVPVLIAAKKRRQIIMVTHNPNLAVVCDAEQVIYSSFDRTRGNKISYVSGSIENPTINKHVIDVLEGTKPAFNNRKMKYH